jgi:tRNA (guanosine-2'-O-)-methyltransferase
MYGFTESFNISVSAAILLYTVMERMRDSDVEWRMNNAELMTLKLDWARKMIHNPEGVEARLRADAIDRGNDGS